MDYKELKLEMNIIINKNTDIEEFKKLTHHIKNLVDLDNWPEINI